MNLKHKLIVAYLLIGILFAIYSWMYGDTAHKPFAYNLGVGLLWITHLPIVGKIISEILSFIVLITIAAVVFFWGSKK